MHICSNKWKVRKHVLYNIKCYANVNYMLLLILRTHGRPMPLGI